MKIYLLDDDASVCTILQLIIREKALGEVCGTSNSALDALDDLPHVTPDIIIVDLLMPVMDGITFVSKARELLPNCAFIMLSQVDSKEMVAKAYDAGVRFFLQKPVNSVEVVRVISNVIETESMRRTLDRVQSLLHGAAPASSAAPAPSGSPAAPVCSESNRSKRLRTALQKLGILGESGAGDIQQIVEYLAEEDPLTWTVSDLCTHFSGDGNPKAMEQRIRRAVSTGLTNIAGRGIEDYSDDAFQEFAGTLYNFEQVRREMDFIRGRSKIHGRVSLKSFLNSLAFYCSE